MKLMPILSPDGPSLDALVAASPLAHLVSRSENTLIATPLPLLLERAANGSAAFIGHFAKANPQVEALERCPDALIIFLGTNGYISPSWFADRTQAPTWNYATAHFTVRVIIDRSETAAREAVDRLTEVMESGRPSAWSGAEMGPRYDRLIEHVVAFRAEITDCAAKFKLGQNKPLDLLTAAIGGVRRDGNHALADAMQTANSSRFDQHGQ